MLIGVTGRGPAGAGGRGRPSCDVHVQAGALARVAAADLAMNLQGLVELATGRSLTKWQVPIGRGTAARSRPSRVCRIASVALRAAPG